MENRYRYRNPDNPYRYDHPTMWSKEQRTRSYFGATLKEAADHGQMAMTIQDTGSGPGLDDVTTLLDARLRLRRAYDDMVKEAKRFVSTDTMFVERPDFYDELISLVHTTGDSVDEALLMSKDYLSDISDIEGTFHTSAAICSQLSSQITRLASKQELSKDETRNLENMKERSRRTFQRMENRLAQVTRRARAGKDTITFPKLQDQVRAARLTLTRTHVPSKHRAHFPTTDTTNKPANGTIAAPTSTRPEAYNYTDRDKRINPTISGTVRVKAAVTEIATGDYGTSQRGHKDTAINGYMGRDGPSRPFSSGTLRQTQPRARATLLCRPFGTVITKQRATTNLAMQLTTDGDRLIPMRRAQQPSEEEEEIQYMPYRPYIQTANAIEHISQETSQPEPNVPMSKNKPPLDADQFRTSSPIRYNTPQHHTSTEIEIVTEIEVVDLEDESRDRPTPYRRPTPRRKQMLHEIAFEDYMRTREKIDPPTATEDKNPNIETTDGVVLPRKLLAPFKHGFHREVVTGPREEQIKIYYITPGGIRTGNMRALEPYIEEFGDISQENFTFQPVTLKFKDPLNKFQSTRKAPTPYQPPRCPQWLHEVNFKDNTPRSPTESTGNNRSTQQEKPKLRRLMDIKLDVTNLTRGYLWQIDQERQRRIKKEESDINPEPQRSENVEKEKPKNYPQRKGNQQPENTTPRRPMMGIHKVTYKDKPPDEVDRHEWP